MWRGVHEFKVPKHVILTSYGLICDGVLSIVSINTRYYLIFAIEDEIIVKLFNKFNLIFDHCHIILFADSSCWLGII